MAIGSLCLMLSTLSITPNRSQFFSYETISLKCEGNSSGWTVNRRTRTATSEKCMQTSTWAVPGESSCVIQDSLKSDTGEYWCESSMGACSNTINITVTDGVVILESPVYPVTEGDTVTLGCFYRKDDQSQITSNFTAAFYNDGVFIGKESAGKLTIKHVSKKNEGLYKCQHDSSKQESPQSLLTVRVRHENRISPTTPLPPPPSPSPPSSLIISTQLMCFVLLFAFYTIILILAVDLFRRLARAQAEVKRRISDHLVLE